MSSVLRRAIRDALGDPQGWSCSHCGPSKHSDANWCDAGCGRDYNQMTPLWDFAAIVGIVDSPEWRGENDVPASDNGGTGQ